MCIVSASGGYTLVLDLDETLVHYVEDDGDEGNYSRFDDESF